MTISNLFKHIQKLNKINSDLGVSTQYGIKFGTLHTYEQPNCWSKPFTKETNFIKETAQETYIENPTSFEITLYEQADSITSLEYKTTITFINALNEQQQIEVDIYIVEVN